jgi:glutathione peroxidase
LAFSSHCQEQGMQNPIRCCRTPQTARTFVGPVVAIAFGILFLQPASAQRTSAPPAKTTTSPPAAGDAPQGIPPKQPGQGGGEGGGGFAGGGGGGRRGGRGGGGGGEAARAEKTAYDFYLPGPDGKNVPLSDYKGKYILIVNLGRKSSYSDQLPALVKLYDTYKSKGLVVIGVPSDEFGAAEPGTDAEIQKAYADAKVDFPIMAVSKLTGDDQLPFFGYLTKGAAAPAGGDIAWNYTKFIIDQKGAVVARIDPDVKPDSDEMMAIIDEVLAGTYKPDKGGGRPGRGGTAVAADTEPN